VTLQSLPSLLSFAGFSIVLVAVLASNEAWTFRAAVATTLVVSGDNRAGLSQIPPAMANFDRALSWRPDSTAALLSRADAYRVLQKYDLGVAEANKAIALDPNDGRFYMARGALQAMAHNNAVALDDLNRALALLPDNVAGLIVRGGVNLDLGKLDAALADADRVLALDAKHSSAHVLRGNVLNDSLETDRALAEFDQALAIAPNNGGAAMMRGRIRFDRRDYAGAIPDFGVAVNFGNRPYAAIWQFLARLRAGQAEQATRELAFWAGALPRDAWPFPLIQLLIGQKTIQQFNPEVKTADARCETQFYLGAWLATGKNFAVAAPLLRAAAATCPKDFIEWRAARAEVALWQDADLSPPQLPNEVKSTDPRVLLDLARKSLGLSQFKLARAALDAALKLPPPSAETQAEAHVLNADYALLADKDDAREKAELDAALALEPNNAAALFARGRHFFRLGAYAEAETDFRSAAANGPASLPAVWLYNAVAARGGDPKAAMLSLGLAAPPKQWPGPLLSLYQSDLNSLGFLNNNLAGQQCQALYYWAAWLVSNKQASRASGAARAAALTCQRNDIEYAAAQQQAAALRKDFPEEFRKFELRERFTRQIK
jgi:tetratricopeptide (TPR) repeat protein